MWDVPSRCVSDINFFGIRVGAELASKELFKKMRYGEIEDGLKRDISNDQKAAELRFFHF